MGHSPSRHAQIAAERARAREIGRNEAPLRKAARDLLVLWNLHAASAWRPLFYPTIRTALLADCPWLHVRCPACGIEGEADLHCLDIHPEASTGFVVARMSCRRCCPHPPFARPIGVTPRSWTHRSPWKRRRAQPWDDLPEIEPEGWAAILPANRRGVSGSRVDGALARTF